MAPEISLNRIRTLNLSVENLKSQKLDTRARDLFGYINGKEFANSCLGAWKTYIYHALELLNSRTWLTEQKEISSLLYGTEYRLGFAALTALEDSPSLSVLAIRPSLSLLLR